VQATAREPTCSVSDAFGAPCLTSFVGRSKMPTLKCSDTMFYSPLDEGMFFDALNKITAIKKIEGRGSDLFLSVPSRLSNKALRELLGLFFRYNVDMRQLARFLTAENRSWFLGRETYWFKRVFAKQ
jgi:hypothetical protein